ncbi:hypothetical protein ARTHRO9AX_180303 [Arthrobacter sp. 9AX]|nr:hypothetical protein ARTHRO9AX_180303 [Arthrobacter sp. 9AX]
MFGREARQAGAAEQGKQPSRGRHIQLISRLIMIWVTLIGSYHKMLTRLAMVWVQRTQKPVET